MRTRTATAALLSVAALGASACGDKLGTDQIAQFATNTSAATSTTATTAVATPSSGKPIEQIEISKDLSKKPEIPKPSGDPPTKLYQRDIVEGKGNAAKSGDKLTVQYVGVNYETGEQFDASWDGGEPFPFELGAQAVIPGWDQGVVGMKEGGRRLLGIPSDLAYGKQGQGTIPPDATLIFVIDLKSIG